MAESQSQNTVESNRALRVSLAEGPEKLVEQVRCLLLVSQQIEQSPATEAPVPPGRHLPDEPTRISALTNIAEQLTDNQRQILYKRVQTIDDLETRLLANARLALLLPPQYFQTIIRDIWQQSAALEAPDSLARVMLQLAPLLTVIGDEPATPPALLEIISIAQAIGNAEARIRSLLILAPYLPHNMRGRVLHRVIDEIDQLNSDTQRTNALCTLADHLTPEINSRALHSAEAIQNPSDRARAFTALARYLPLKPELRSEALSTIEIIRDEEERADALIAFAPHLEYITESDHFPILLEKALAIAISIKRRHLRARTLVALAPHLTLDLQGEALAAVHGLDSERERSMMLAELAPYLPPNMLVASLAVAHSIQSQDARVHALTILARYVPESARERTVLDALAAASNLSHHYERVSALNDLIDVLPSHLRDQTHRNALEIAQMIDNQSARARALSILGPGLPPRLRQRALESAQLIENPDYRLTAFTGIMSALTEDERQAVAQSLLETIRELPFEYKQARAIAEIAPYLPAEHIHEAIEIVQDVEDPMDQVTGLTALASRLPENAQREWLGKAWKLIKEIDSGYDAASALASLAPLLPPQAAKDVANAASMIIGAIMDEYDQASAIALLAPLLSLENKHDDKPSLPDKHAALERALQGILRLADQELRLSLLETSARVWSEISEHDHSYQLWQQVVESLAAFPHLDVIFSLGKLTPVIQQLGGDTTAGEIATMLEDYDTLSVAESDQ